MQFKAALLVSGNLGLTCLKEFPAECTIVCIFTDKGSSSIIEWAKEKGISCFCGNPRSGRASEFMRGYRPDIIFSINYLFLIESDVITWPVKYCFNIHGSLLPKYRGRTPHVWAIINGENETGATVHLVDEGCDTGAIVLQEKINITFEMSGADILAGFYELYPRMINSVIEKVKKNRVQPVSQDNSKATYFGVRTPESGQIDWDWHKQRIYNWVRAQASPYPQAFTFFNDQKIKINRISFSDHGFNSSDSNGLILSLTNGLPVIKTPNGAVQVEEFESGNLILKAGNTLL